MRRSGLAALSFAIILSGCEGARQDDALPVVSKNPDAPESPPTSATPTPPLVAAADKAKEPAKDAKPLKPSPGAPEFHAPDPSRPIRTFEQIAALPNAEFDVAEAVLALGQEATVSGDPQAALKELDRLAARARADLPDKPDAQDCFDTLYDLVLNRKSADPFREDRAEDYDLTFTVSRRRGDCLSVGIMTLAVARRIGAPVWGAQCPAHFFLRSLPEADKNGKLAPINFDVTRLTPENWSRLDDEFYRRWQHFDEKAEAAGAYMRALTDREVVSVFLSSRSGFYAGKKQHAQSLKDAQRSLELNPRNITACINGGYAEEQLGNLHAARDFYVQALKVDPNSVRALNNLAYVKVKDAAAPEFDPKGAEKLIDSALRIDPNKAYLHATYGEVKAAQKDWRGATRALQDAMKLEPKNAAYRERMLALREQLRAQ